MRQEAPCAQLSDVVWKSTPEPLLKVPLRNHVSAETYIRFMTAGTNGPALEGAKI
jgi:hypothetical protein